MIGVTRCTGHKPEIIALGIEGDSGGHWFKIRCRICGKVWDSQHYPDHWKMNEAVPVRETHHIEEIPVSWQRMKYFLSGIQELADSDKEMDDGN